MSRVERARSIFAADRMVRYLRALGADAARNIEVTGSHCGMAVNAQIYGHLATLLQPPPQS
ncbi:MAG: hypothetical protein ACLQBA_16915 [Candidatus Binataceae bacterium]